MMNNYFHDVATALLITSALVILFLARSAEQTGEVEVIRYFVGLYPKLTILARVSMAWIVLGGVIRFLNFMSFEMLQAEIKGATVVIALVIKHILIFTVVGIGGYKWRKLSNRVKELRAALPEPAPEGQ